MIPNDILLYLYICVLFSNSQRNFLCQQMVVNAENKESHQGERESK